MKILINTPFLDGMGGVANHYLGLKPFFSGQVVYNPIITCNYLRRKLRFPVLYIPVRYFGIFYDILKFIYLIIKYKKPNILLNPSFRKASFKRDIIFLKIGKLFNCKVAVFIHGWDKELFQEFIDSPNRFKAWKNVDAYFVLANEFKRSLEKLGVTSPIYITSTKVDDKLIDDIRAKNKIKNILFLARIEKSKGILLTIDVIEILVKRGIDIGLRVVGSGSALQKARKYSDSKNLKDYISFTGPLVGTLLKNEFQNADIYILPTHGEGMPTSVLESMAFGLPVITRPVGGLVDFFKEPEMGYLIDGLMPIEYADKIEYLINNPSIAKAISRYNAAYAKKHFLASNVASRLENHLSNIK